MMNVSNKHSAKLFTVALLVLSSAACSPSQIGLEPRAASASPLPAGATSAAANAQHGRKRALLVGISAYPQLRGAKSPWSVLHTEEDLRGLTEALELHGFAKNDIHPLQDAPASKVGIERAFQQLLIDPAAPGDTIVFHFSGHGRQVKDDDKNEELDGLDETLVPADATESDAISSARTNIRDDTLGKWIAKLEDKMRDPPQTGAVKGSILITLDSCFSGTGTRTGRSVGDRGMGWDSSDGAPPPWSSKEHSGQRARVGSMRDAENSTVVITAAQSNQPARESRKRGVFSQALADSLKRAHSLTTYQDLFADIALELIELKVRSQTPLLEGNGDQYLFSGAARPRDNAVSITMIGDRTFTIAQGQLHLVSTGSVYRVYADAALPGAAPITLGDAQVKDVQIQQGTLEFLPGDALPRDQAQRELLLRRARAVETVHSYKADRLRVLIRGASGPLLTELEQNSMLKLIPDDGSPYDVEVQVRDGRVSVHRPQVQKPLLDSLLDSEISDSYWGLRRALHKQWRWLTVSRLSSPDQKMEVSLRIVPVRAEIKGDTIVSGPTARKDVAKTTPLRLLEEDLYQLELRNHAPVDLWASVLELGPDDSIDIRYPMEQHKGDGLIPAGKTRLIPVKDKYYLYRVCPPLGRSIFKVIATPKWINLSSLVQAGSGDRRSVSAPDPKTQVQALPKLFQPLGELLSLSSEHWRATNLVSVDISTYGIRTAFLDQEAKTPGAGSAWSTGSLCDE